METYIATQFSELDLKPNLGNYIVQLECCRVGIQDCSESESILIIEKDLIDTVIPC